MPSNLQIRIVSGEGNQGTVELYTGKRSIRALKIRLTRERRNGRWARAEYNYRNIGWIPYTDLDLNTWSDADLV